MHEEKGQPDRVQLFEHRAQVSDEIDKLLIAEIGSRHAVLSIENESSKLSVAVIQLAFKPRSARTGAVEGMAAGAVAHIQALSDIGSTGQAIRELDLVFLRVLFR